MGAKKWSAFQTIRALFPGVFSAEHFKRLALKEDKMHWFDYFWVSRDQSHSFSSSERWQFGPRGQRSVIIWGRRSMPFAQAWRGSDFNAPLWAALTANDINSSRKNTHSNTQTRRISARINTPRHKGNPSDRCGGERESGEHTHSKLLETNIAQPQ